MPMLSTAQDPSHAVHLAVIYSVQKNGEKTLKIPLGTWLLKIFMMKSLRAIKMELEF